MWKQFTGVRPGDLPYLRRIKIAVRQRGQWFGVSHIVGIIAAEQNAFGAEIANQIFQCHAAMGNRVEVQQLNIVGRRFGNFSLSRV
jgi:hypothetical protein